MGSIWRKWDLHIHTPFSVLNHGDFGDGFSMDDTELDIYIYKLFKKAVENDIKVIGVTDYFTIDGYKKIRETLKNKNRIKNIFKDELLKDNNYLDKVESILLLANIELRLDKALFDSNNKGSKFQIHVIFSNKLNSNEIEENFINQLKFSSSSNDSMPITKNNIENYGKSLKSSGVGGMGSDLYVGMNNIYVNFDDLKTLLNQDQFKNKHIIVLPEEDQSKLNWLDQTAGIRKNMYSLSDAIFSSNNRTINWGQGESCYKILNKHMPCLWGSDAHKYEEMFNPNENRFTWIKADTTFEGLLQTIKNFKNRIYIGEIPDELNKINQRLDFSLNRLNSKLKKDDKTHKIWFDIELDFNPSMIAIIGNKGSGKSALSDIIGYMGNTYNTDSLSFLHKQRFLDPKTKFGDLYLTEAMFGSDVVIKEKLSNDTDLSKHEKIKYLPQKYIEDIVNDLGEEFQKEIDKTIFSYIPITEKGDADNLDDLISSKSRNTSTQIENKRNQLKRLNQEIYDLEKKCTDQYRSDILAKLSLQKQKLANHISNKPTEIKPVSDEVKTVNSEIIAELNLKKMEITEAIQKNVTSLTEINYKLQVISDFKEKLVSFNKSVEELNLVYAKLTKTLSIKINSIVEVNYNDDEIKELENSLKFKKVKLNDELDDTKLILNNLEIPTIVDYSNKKLFEKLNDYKSLKYKKHIIEVTINNLSAGVSVEERKYLDYVANLKKWEESRKMITGELLNIEDGESIKKYEDILKHINDSLLEELDSKYEKRNEYISDIFNYKKENIELLESMYKPIQQKINKIINSEVEKIEFIAQINTKNEDIVDNISKLIDSRADSDFRGRSEGYRLIQELVDSTDFNIKDSVLNFTKELLTRTTTNKNNIDKILNTPTIFYDYVTSLEYLNTDYTIISNRKNLKELSPGERGIILLIFYLALSKENIPLVIDQPEDNLDNQSIYSRLVPAILEAKKNRQVIIVTHNPNIAIACDAEQIIYCSVDKETGELKYDSGSIENPIIMKHIVDVLEGTKPAFTKRKETYE